MIVQRIELQRLSDRKRIDVMADHEVVQSSADGYEHNDSCVAVLDETDEGVSWGSQLPFSVRSRTTQGFPP